MRRVVAALAVLALTGVGSFLVLGDRREPASAAEPARFLPGSPREGAGGALNQIPEADCAGWRQASLEQRVYAVRQLGAHFSRRTRGGGGHKLPDRYAMGVMQRACANGFATRFKLWKLYEKALAFQYDRSAEGV